jgi:hypothetical protein
LFCVICNHIISKSIIFHSNSLTPKEGEGKHVFETKIRGKYCGGKKYYRIQWHNGENMNIPAAIVNATSACSQQSTIDPCPEQHEFRPHPPTVLP